MNMLTCNTPSLEKPEMFHDGAVKAGEAGAVKQISLQSSSFGPHLHRDAAQRCLQVLRLSARRLQGEKAQRESQHITHAPFLGLRN